MDKNTKISAMALKELLGTIEMEAIPGECVIENDQLIQRRAYYVARSNIHTLGLLEKTQGANSLRCRKKRDSNPRSLAGLLFSRQPH